MRRSWDLLAIIALSLLLALFVYAVPDNLGRVVLGIPFILFFPGYALVSSLFPEKSSLDLIERIALSFGLSIAIVPLIGFGLNYTRFGIRLEPILWSLIAFNIAFSMVALWRRSSSKEPFLPFEPRLIYGSTMSKFRRGSRVDKVLAIILILSVLSSVFALGYVIAFPREGEHFTEFYLLGLGGNATGYPSNITVNQLNPVIVGIANHEYRTIDYTVEVWLVNATYDNNTTSIHRLYYIDSFNQTLEHITPNAEGKWTKQWETTYNISVPYPGQYKMWFVLLKDESVVVAEPFNDYVGTELEARFREMTGPGSEHLSLNLNLNVSP